MALCEFAVDAIWSTAMGIAPRRARFCHDIGRRCIKGPGEAKGVLCEAGG